MSAKFCVWRERESSFQKEERCKRTTKKNRDAKEQHPGFQRGPPP
jgi:hypothetical protein